MVSTDSCLAGSMKLQVLTTSTSAWSGCEVSSCPHAASWPIITSLSTRFLGQPRLTKPIFKRGNFMIPAHKTRLIQASGDDGGGIVFLVPRWPESCRDSGKTEIMKLGSDEAFST